MILSYKIILETFEFLCIKLEENLESKTPLKNEGIEAIRFNNPITLLRPDS